MALAIEGLGWVARPFRIYPRITRTIFALGALMLALFIGANAYILLSTRGEATGDISAVPHAQVAIVPGALVQPDGTMSAMLASRVARSAALWKAGKVNRILVSGDHHSWAYDEPDTMREALVADGVPPRVIFEDHAGFDTWATMVRAVNVFEARSAIVVTQHFHMPRALYLGKQAGLDIHGLYAYNDGGAQGLKSNVRELFSRVKAIADTTLGTTKVMGGRKIPIMGDNGRVSWGPAPPRGTPPAGAPAH